MLKTLILRYYSYMDKNINRLRLLQKVALFLVMAFLTQSECYSQYTGHLADTLSLYNGNISTLSDSVINEDDNDFGYRVITLDGLEVSGRFNKYSKKDNPAYELMKRIRNNKYLGDPRVLPEYTESFYTKTVLGLNNCDASQFKGKDKLKYIQEYVDTASHSGEPVLLISLREKAGTILHSLDFRKDKTVVQAQRSVGIDDEFNQDNISIMLDEIFNPVDIYKDDIVMMGQHFVSPLSHLADNFYRYFLNDTVIIDKKPHIELTFAPVSAESFGFNGRMFIEAGDSTFFIKRIEMRVPRVINLNYVDNVFINQDYYKDEYGKRHKKNDETILELSLMPGTLPLYGKRVSRYGDPQFTEANNLHNFLYDASEYIVYENANLQPWDKWNEFRLLPLSKAEGEMGSFMNRMRQYPLIYWSEKILKILVNGYVATGKNSKVDLGPINSIISYNHMEGVRFRLGGLTTANLSPHWFGRGYVAYGCRDKKIKYLAELEYSFLAKNYHSREFPVNSIRLHYGYDLDEIGQHYVYTNSDNIFLSIKRKGSDLALYKREAGCTYQLELQNHLSMLVGFKHRIFEATSYLPFVFNDGKAIPNYTLAGFNLELRYAPGERFLQGAQHRSKINHDAPVIILSHEIVPGGMLGSRFTFNKTELTLSKRIWFSAFGYMDCILKGGKIWSTVDYPQLLWQNANLSFTIQPESYSLLNPMEFPIDYFGSLDISYFGNGILFNRIPLIKRLKLREVITFKGLMGGLTHKNDPDYNETLMRFPYHAATGRLTSKPYMELGFGLDNILTFLRVDYIWRLTYRNLPNVSRGGFRLTAHFSF